jgi:acyl-CoA synthetase (NDP forming)
MTSRVAIKAIAPELSQRADAGVIEFDLDSPEEAGAAADRMAERLMLEGVDVTGFIVQEMVDGGVDLLVGAINDPTFGPIIACSAGGLGTELWRDIQLRLAPVGPRTAAEMLEELQCFPLLLGWRGAPAVQLGQVHDVLRRVAALAADRPEIAELECNPLVATAEGVVAVDLRVRLHPA